jgi:hypothetical protein
LSIEQQTPDGVGAAKPSARDWGLSGKSEHALAAGILAVLVYLVYFAGRPIYNSIDYTAIYVPHFHFLFESLGNGEIPWWNPYVGLGRPMMSDIHFGFLYPPTYLFALGEKPGLFLNLWFHSWLLWWGIRGLAIELGATRMLAFVAGIIVSLSGNYCGRMLSGMLYYVFQEAYAPLIFWLTIRLGSVWDWKRVGYLGLAVAAMFLCGNGHVFWIIMVGAGFFLAGRLLLEHQEITVTAAVRVLGQFAAALAICAALAAFAWLPYLDLIQNSNRTEPTIEFATFLSAPPRLLGTMIAMPASSLPADWEQNFFIGAFWVLTGVLGCLRIPDPRVRSLGFVTLFAVIYSLGAHTPVFQVFYNLVPGADMFRIPPRMMLLPTVALPVAGAVFASRMAELKDVRGWIVGLGIGLVIWLLGLMQGEPATGLFLPSTLALAAVILTVALLLIWQRASWKIGMAGLAVIGLIEFAPATIRMQRDYIPVKNIAPLANPSVQAVRQMKDTLDLPANAPPPRANIDSMLFLRNSGMLIGVADVTADTPLFLRRPWNYLHAVSGVPFSAVHNNSLPMEIGQMPPQALRYVSVKLGLDRAKNEMVLVKRPFPRAYFTSRVIPAFDESDATRILLATPTPEPIAVIESAIRPSVSGDEFFEQRIDRFGHSRLEISVTNRSSGYLVLNESWFPGWRALRGDKEIPAEPVNVWMRGFPLEPGNEPVTIEFRPRRFGPGCLVSAVGLLVVGMMIFRSERIPWPTKPG